jgi:predicted enzyme related to lactoylglutathione lyase
MQTGISHITLLVHDQDEALAWYRDVFGWEVREDNSGTIPGFRWLTMGIPGDSLNIVVMAAGSDPEGSPCNPTTSEQVGKSQIIVIATNDCQAAYDDAVGKGAEGLSAPSPVPWGVSAVVRDLYGNAFNLVQTGEVKE